MKAVLPLFAWLFLIGCAAHSDLNKTSRPSTFGGFKDKELAQGVFFIEATSGFAPWKNSSGAQNTFERRAEELCGDNRFESLWVYEETGTPLGLRGYKTTTFVGYVRDADSPLSIEEAKRAVNDQRAKAGLFQISQWLK
jgi:hypothetical protein